MSKQKRLKNRMSRFEVEQAIVKVSRKGERAQRHAEAKAFAARNPTPKLHKSTRMRFRNRVQLVEGTLSDTMLEKFGMREGNMLTTVYHEALAACRDDELIKNAVERRKATND